jgi:hypothetical protein
MGVRLYYDLDLKKLVALPGYPDLIRSVTHKRGDGDSVELSFCRGAVAAVIGTPTEMVYVVKVDFGELTEPLVLANTGDWTLDVGSGIWSAPLTSDSAAILTHLNGAETASAKAEFTFTDDLNGGPSTSQTLVASLSNDLWKGTEGTPLTLPTPAEWLALQNAAIREALGIPTCADLAAANLELAVGMNYYDEALGTLNTATA